MAELLRLTEKAAAATPRAPSPAPRASSAVALATPVTCSNVPTWNDALIQTFVQQSVRQSLQAEVEPRLEGLAERFSGVVASAQGELQELRRLLERSEARAEGRLTGLEKRISSLADGATRAEHRERDLNQRIAALAERWLSGADDAASHEAAHAPRIGELERFMRDASPRLGILETSCQREGQRQRALEERVRDFEQRIRAASRVGDELRDLMESRRGADLAMAGGGAGVEARLAAMERRLAQGSSGPTTPRAGSVAAEAPGACLVSVLEGKLDSHRMEFDNMSTQLLSQCRELQDRLADQARRHEENRAEARGNSERFRSLASRVEEIGQSASALKVKTEGLEGRMLKVAERAEAACRPLEAQFKSQLEDQRRWLTGETETRLELLERRVEAVRQICEDAAEEAARGKAAQRRHGSERGARSQDRGAESSGSAGPGGSRPPRPHREEARSRGPSPRPGAEWEWQGGG